MYSAFFAIRACKAFPAEVTWDQFRTFGYRVVEASYEFISLDVLKENRLDPVEGLGDILFVLSAGPGFPYSQSFSIAVFVFAMCSFCRV